MPTKNLTRLVCVAIVLGWLGTAVWAALYISRVTFDRTAMLAFGLFAVLVAPLLLEMWRKCARCRRELFTDRLKPKVEGSRFLGFVAERDYRARTLLGSYRNAAIVDMALKGKLRCMWCGHEDGKKPDYISVGTE